MQDVGYANYPPFEAFYVSWLAAAPGEDVTPVWGCSLALHAPEFGKDILVDAAPMLTGLVTAMAHRALLYSPYRPYTFGVSTNVPATTALLYPKEFGSFDEAGASYFLVVSGPRVLQAVAVPGATAARPYAFAADGRRVLARIARPFSQEHPVAIMDLESGKTVPCKHVPWFSQVLAASSDLQHIVVKQEDRLFLTQADRQGDEIARAPEEASVMADCVDGLFFITDGQRLWRVAPTGRVMEIELRQSSTTTKSAATTTAPEGQ